MLNRSLKMVSKSGFVIAFSLISCALVEAQPLTSRVVGGKDADYGQFPYQVVLYKNGSFSCGGSVMSSRYVLTAAHCVTGDGIETLPPILFTVRAGTIQREAGGMKVGVIKVIVRQSYEKFLDDVALLELEKELIFNKNIQKIDLYDTEVPNGAEIVISGWGRLSTGGQVPLRLQYNTLTKMDASDCQKAIGYGNEQIICLAHEKNNGACKGDSGGPAMYEGKLVGVSGFVVGGCGSKNPDGYAKVSYHRDWILQHIN